MNARVFQKLWFGRFRALTAPPLMSSVFFLGEGIGSEIVPVAIDLLRTISRFSKRNVQLHEGGLIGYPAKTISGSSLSADVIAFAQRIFGVNGALFCGPGGERFVYELRREFDLYCKFTPLEPLPELRQAGVVRSAALATANIVAVRENSGGIYQGEWESVGNAEGGRSASHRFSYSEAMVRRILSVAMRLAASRRQRLHVILKPGGIPSISELWQDCAKSMAGDFGIELFEQEIDNAVYQLVANPAQFDVIVSPNMFGDVLADCGSLLLGSRGLSYSGNFNDAGNGVYQTGHGAARDLAGKGVVNPTGQIFSLGMMLRESFDWPEADVALRHAVRRTISEGLCTGDIPMPTHEVVGIERFAAAVKCNLEEYLAEHAV